MTLCPDPALLNDGLKFHEYVEKLGISYPGGHSPGSGFSLGVKGPAQNRNDMNFDVATLFQNAQPLFYQLPVARYRPAILKNRPSPFLIVLHRLLVAIGLFPAPIPGIESFVSCTQVFLLLQFLYFNFTIIYLCSF